MLSSCSFAKPTTFIHRISLLLHSNNHRRFVVFVITFNDIFFMWRVHTITITLHPSPCYMYFLSLITCKNIFPTKKHLWNLMETGRQVHILISGEKKTYIRKVTSKQSKRNAPFCKYYEAMNVRKCDTNTNLSSSMQFCLHFFSFFSLYE